MDNKIVPVVPENVIFRIIQNAGEEQEKLKQILLNHLSEEDRLEFEAILRGELLPSLMSDIIAKKIFDPMEHFDRLEYLLREVAGDETICIDKAANNEGYIQSEYSKKLIFDIPAWTQDERFADLEMQVNSQEFILERGEIYSSDMLRMQYSVKKGVAKSSLDFKNTKGVLLVVLMRNSPDKFKEFPGDRYIHRFGSYTADSGFVYEKPLKNVVYVQLDKCFEQFIKGMDGENNPELQLLLAALYDINDERVLEKAKENNMLKEIISEARKMSQDKEVQAMLLAERYASADLRAMRSYERNEGIREGKREGKDEAFYTLVQDGKLSVETGAEYAGVSVPEFEKAMTAAGYKIPAEV